MPADHACAAACVLQIRRKGDDENLAEWIVDITTEADRQGSDRFTTAYQACARSPCVPVNC